MPISVQIDELIRFYDEDVRARPHANSIKAIAGEDLGFALLEHYFEHEEKQNITCLRRSDKTPEPCTTKGFWLDGWLVDQFGNPLFQVEIKSWSFHGYGSGKRRLPLNDVCPDSLQAHIKTIWGKYWKCTNPGVGVFNEIALNKVLLRMKPPVNANVEIEAILCLWEAVHPDGLTNSPLFQVEVDTEQEINQKSNRPLLPDFKHIYVFSMSLYLRMLLAKNSPTMCLSLNLPLVEERLKRLKLMFQ